MNIDLTHEMCIDLVMGSGGPNYSLFGIMEMYGYYDDNRGWIWHRDKLKDKSINDLFAIYNNCKNSWNK